MAERGGELSRLRRRVASYVKALIALGLSAQTFSSSGGSYLAVSRLISSGIALAGQLQRGIIVRVVGAPLVRRRPGRHPRAGPREEYPEPPAPHSEETSLQGPPGTGWSETTPPPLALAELDTQPFSLARALPALVAAQQTAFRAISSVNGAVASAIGGTRFAILPSREAPSQTSLEHPQRVSPEAFPEGQATSFAEGPAPLSVGAAFRGNASSMAFNLTSAAHEMTNLALGSQAVGAGFAPQIPRLPREGTAFQTTSPGFASPSLLQPSISGSEDTSFRSAPPSGANLGIAPGAGTPTTSRSAPSARPLSDLPVSRDASVPSDLSARVAGPSDAVAPADAAQGPPESGPQAELNAGPYTVPNGFNSAMGSAAFSLGSQLSMQVRSLASAGPNAQLRLRASQRESDAPSAGPGLALVPEQYPSSYPVGAAYSMSAIVASLGLAPPGPSRPAASREGSGQRLSSEEAPGIETPAETKGGAFLGATLAGRGAGGPDLVVPAVAGQAEEALDYVADGGGTSPRAPLDSGVQRPAPSASFGSAPRAFGERWLSSVASAASLGRAMMATLAAAGAPPIGGLPSGVGVAPARAAMPTAPGEQAVPSYARQTGEGGGSRFGGVPPMPLAPSAQTRPVGLAVPTRDSQAGVAQQGRDAGPTGRAARPDLPLSAPPREPVPLRASPGQPTSSVWEAVTLLPGLLTPALAALPAVGGPRDEAFAPGGRAQGAQAARAGAPSGLGAEEPQAPAPGPEALRVATSLRSALVSAIPLALGAKAPVKDFATDVPEPGRLTGRLPRGAADAESARSPESAPQGGSRTKPSLELSSPGERGPGTFVRTGTAALVKRVDLFEPSAEEEPRRRTAEGSPVKGFTTSYLPALQAFLASRAMLAARATGSAATALSLLRVAASSRTESEQPFPTSPPPSTPTSRTESAWQDAGPREVPGLGQAGLAPRSPGIGPPQPAAEPAGRALEAPVPIIPEAAMEPGRVLAARPPKGAGTTREFFGLDAVAEALSLAARLPPAAALNATVGASLPKARARAAAPGGQTERMAAAAPTHAIEQQRHLVEGWRSAPEEAIERALEGTSSQPSTPGREAPRESDDRELRRRIEKMLDEDLRRHGYQA